MYIQVIIVLNVSAVYTKHASGAEPLAPCLHCLQHLETITSLQTITSTDGNINSWKYWLLIDIYYCWFNISMKCIINMTLNNNNQPTIDCSPQTKRKVNSALSQNGYNNNIGSIDIMTQQLYDNDGNNDNGNKNRFEVIEIMNDYDKYSKILKVKDLKCNDNNDEQDADIKMEYSQEWIVLHAPSFPCTRREILVNNIRFYMVIWHTNYFNNICNQFNPKIFNKSNRTKCI